MKDKLSIDSIFILDSWINNGETLNSSSIVASYRDSSYSYAVFGFISVLPSTYCYEFEIISLKSTMPVNTFYI